MELANEIVPEWYNKTIKGETETVLTNFLDLINENKEETPYKIFDHTPDLGSTTEGFMMQMLKDVDEINECEEEHRYDDVKKYDFDKIRVWFATKNAELNYTEKRIAKCCSKDSLMEFIASEDFSSEDKSASEFEDKLKYYFEDVEKFLVSPETKIEYIAFIHTEYEYLPLVMKDNSFEAGLRCSRLQVFRIADKECVLDKRIFAENADEVAFYSNTERPRNLNEVDLKSDLRQMTEYEALLQCVKAGLPYSKKSK